MDDIEKAIENKAAEISGRLNKLEKKILKLLEQRRDLVDCLHLVKDGLLSGDVRLYKITRLIDSALTKIAKGE